MKEIGRDVLLINKTMTLADTEYSQTLPEGTAKFLVQNRGSYDTKLSFNASASSTNYLTVKAGNVYYEDMINTSRSLYFQCSQAGQVLEIIVWVK
jgi:hypothetical protein